MSKIILLDADGVVLKKQPYFSITFAEERNIPLENITRFFVNEFQDCLTGKCDLKESISPKLSGWGWKESADEFLNYWFNTDVEVDPEVVDKLSELKTRGSRLYLASNQEKYRAQFIYDKLKYANLDGYFFSHELGIEKPTEQFFENILRNLGVEPEDVVFFDDDQRNVVAAKQIGIDARLFVNADDLIL